MARETAPDPWESARTATRTEVQAIFAPSEQVCPACGRTASTAARNCPHCGASYVVFRQRLSRRAKLTIAGVVAGLALVAGATALLSAPSIDRAKRRDSAREAAAKEARQAALRRELRLEQRPQARRVAAAGLPADPLAARAALVDRLEAAVGRDARARVAAGDLRGPIIGATCTPYPATEGRAAMERDLSLPGNVYECTAKTSVIPATESNREGFLGYPFLAVIDYETRTLTWCKVNPPPGEQLIGAAVVVELSPRCTKAPER